MKEAHHTHPYAVQSTFLPCRVVRWNAMVPPPLYVDAHKIMASSRWSLMDQIFTANIFNHSVLYLLVTEQLLGQLVTHMQISSLVANRKQE